MIAYGTFSLIDTFGQLNEARARNEELKTEIVALREENSDLDCLIKNFDTDTTKAKLASERLGLVKPGEIVFTNQPIQTDAETDEN